MSTHLADTEVLSRSVVLRGLPPDEMELVQKLLRRRSYRRGEVIFHQGDPAQALHMICQGSIKIVLPNDNGEEAILAILGPGDVVGEMALLDAQPRSATVVALEAVETATLSRADFLELLRRSPTAVEGVLGMLAATIRRLSGEVGGLMFLDLHGRLARKLLELAEIHGRELEDGIEIQVPLTQEELAGMVGATRPRVNKVLGYYEEHGSIIRQGRRIVILKPELLRRWSST